jgi:hypothetical protein
MRSLHRLWQELHVIHAKELSVMANDARRPQRLDERQSFIEPSTPRRKRSVLTEPTIFISS